MKRYRPIFSENKKEKFIAELIEKTEENELSWEQSSTDNYNKFIYHSDLVIRLFVSHYKSKIFVVIEKKVSTYSSDFDDYFDKAYVEVLILESEVGLQTSIDQETVSRDLLFNLFSVIEDSTVDIENIFND